MTQEQLEARAMELLLRGEDAISRQLYQQYKSSKLVKRDFTNRGFFSEYVYPDELKIGGLSGRIMGAGVDYKDIDDGMEFVLFLNNGGIDTLEGFSILNNWFEKDIDKIDESTFEPLNLDIFVKNAPET